MCLVGGLRLTLHALYAPYHRFPQATGQHFVMGGRFSLGDLLALGLHNHVDACTGATLEAAPLCTFWKVWTWRQPAPSPLPPIEIVDRAQKELTVEKALRKIEDTWGGLSLAFAPYQDTGMSGLGGLAHLLCLLPDRLLLTPLGS